MNRANPMRRSRSGQALIIALLLLSFLMLLIAGIFRENMQRRLVQQDEMDKRTAFNMAESGVQRALHAIAAGKTSGIMEAPCGSGSFRVEWSSGKAPFPIWISSTGISHPDVPGSAQKTIEVNRVWSEDQAPAPRPASGNRN
jgi:Tfp pilus assembly protein PilX